MSFGFHELRLSSAELWAMTPRELAAAMQPFGGETTLPPARRELLGLMGMFPDGPGGLGGS